VLHTVSFPWYVKAWILIITFILFHSASRLYVRSSFPTQAAINFSFQHSSQMKTLSIRKGYVTVYFFAIMVHCSLFYILVTKQYHATPCLCALDMFLFCFWLNFSWVWMPECARARWARFVCPFFYPRYSLPLRESSRIKCKELANKSSID